MRLVIFVANQVVVSTINGQCRVGQRLPLEFFRRHTQVVGHGLLQRTMSVRVGVSFLEFVLFLEETKNLELFCPVTPLKVSCGPLRETSRLRKGTVSCQ